MPNSVLRNTEKLNNNKTMTSEYDQDIPESDIKDKPMTPWERNKVKATHPKVMNNEVGAH